MLWKRPYARSAVVIALALGAVAATGLAYAEEATLEEVVITARKRTENLQDVANAISALSSKDLARRFDTDLRDFVTAAPNVVIDDLQQGPGSPAAIAIRGVGTTDVEKSFDPATGVVVDGIFIGANSGAMVRAVDLERVEVLRGPQGTLFGRNSIAGVINITRNQPSTDSVSGLARLGYGNYNDLLADGYINLPVTDAFAFKIGVAKRERDGYYHNVFWANTPCGPSYPNNPCAIQRVGYQDFKSLSPQFLWKITSSIQLSYRFDKTWQRQDTDVQLNLAQSNQVWCFYYKQCAQSLTVPQSGDRYVIDSDLAPKPAFFDTEMHNVHLAWDLGSGYTLDYLFGYFKTAENAYQDWDGTPLALYSTLRPATYYQHSHELRFTSVSRGPLSYTVGLYGWNSGYRIDLTSYIGFVDFLSGGALPPGTQVTVPQTVQQKTDSYAGFFEGDYRFGNHWTLNVGGRYTHDRKTSGLIDPSMPELATKGSLDNPFEASWSQFTPKASLKYQFTQDVMAYALYSKGFRAGGFDGRPGVYNAAATPYNPEKVDNYEIGWKSELLDRRLRLNLALFVMKYKDKQEEESINAPSGTGQETLVVNAADATIKGFEADFAANLLTGFTVIGNLGILQAKYDHLVDPITMTDLSYLHLRRAPPVTATITPAYEWALGKGSASVSLTYHYVGPMELTFLNSPQGSNPHQNILDASINYTIGLTTVSAYGQNLTKGDAWTQAYDVGRSVGFPGLWTYATPRAPLTYGLRITQSF
jgi:iron complex outermembrane receptor protein